MQPILGKDVLLDAHMHGLCKTTVCTEKYRLRHADSHSSKTLSKALKEAFKENQQKTAPNWAKVKDQMRSRFMSGYGSLGS